MKSDLRTIPGVGVSIEKDLEGLGIKKVSDLIGKNPEALYEKLCKKEGQHIDRCMLYVFRCAVYFAETKHPNPKKLLWWNWKDQIKKK